MRSVRSRRNPRGEGGFSLVELLVVVLIIGILMAIAIPTMLDQRRKAQSRDPQSALATGLRTALSYYTISATYNGLTPGQMNIDEPSLFFTPGVTIDNTNKRTGGKRTIAVFVVSDDAVRMYAKGDNGVCYGVEDHAVYGTHYFTGASPSDCPAVSAAMTQDRY